MSEEQSNFIYDIIDQDLAEGADEAAHQKGFQIHHTAASSRMR